MKTKINHILPVLLLTAASGLTTVSCNDFLDKTPDNRTELNTDQKIAKLLVSAYPDVSPNELFELYSDNSDDRAPPTVTTSFPKRNVTTGKIPKRNIRTHPIPFGEVITVQFQPPTWHSRR